MVTAVGKHEALYLIHPTMSRCLHVTCTALKAKLNSQPLKRVAHIKGC